MGTRNSVKNNSISEWDHPHACGDKNGDVVEKSESPGSSPRVWGQDSVLYDGCNHIGIIPTRVGTRRTDEALRNPRRDHPHACGDKYTAGLDKKFTEGSSPRVWGQGFVNVL